MRFRRQRRVLRLAALVLVGWVISPTVLLAGESGVQGTVTDEGGGALAGAVVQLLSAPEGYEASTITDARGQFRIDGVPIGDYVVTVSIRGFESWTDTVRVANEGVVSLRLRLTLAPFSQEVNVVAVSPILGTGVDPRRVPAHVSLMSSDELRERRDASIAGALHARLGAVTLEGATGNTYQPTLRFRGFTASSLLGLPQGIAVYQNGVRVNEPFGDTVQFDLIPQFAVETAQLSAGASPTFGLNALGGALAMRLKNGFDSPGFRGEISGGSFERGTATADFGMSRGPWALYLGATGFTEAGWRTASDSDLVQAVGDVGYRTATVDAGVSVTYADTKLNGNGPAPVELVEVNPSAVFTFPDTTENRLAFVQGRASIALPSSWSLELTGYFRDLDRQTLNGDAAAFSVCGDDELPAGAPLSTLCTGAAAVVDADADVEALVDIPFGRFITQRDARGDGAINRTLTDTTGYGSALQLSSTSRFAGRDNILVFGASVDAADVAFGSNVEVGTLTPERSVDGSGLFAGVFMETPDDIFNTALETDNRGFGLYASDTLSITDRIHVTASGRFDDTRIEIRDQLGTSLDGEHRFSRLNPAIGIVVEATPSWSVFARYAESIRAPTAAELSCADPAEPCRVPNAFVSDPPLQKAVARSIEVGARGSQGRIDWSATFYRTMTRDDILFVASPELIGSGFFQNAGDVRRVGADVDLSGNFERLLEWYISYGLVDATFDSLLVLPANSEVNDAAAEQGLSVEPGDRLPGIPRHSLKAGASIELSLAWSAQIEAVVASSRVYVGDEGNDQEPLEGYGIVNLRSAYRLSEHVELFARIDNLFDARYATFGILAELEVELAEAPDASEPRFISPGSPRSAFAGVSIKF